MEYREVDKIQYLTVVTIVNSMLIDNSTEERQIRSILKSQFGWSKKCIDYHIKLYGLETPELERFYQ